MHEMMIPADAKAIGMITARSTSQRRQPRSRTMALTPCISIMPDGTRVEFTVHRQRNTHKRRSTPLNNAINNNKKRHDINAVLQSLPSIHQ